jgi:hypothetical protein
MCMVMMSILQDLIPEVICSQNVTINVGPILSGYRAMARNSR